MIKANFAKTKLRHFAYRLRHHPAVERADGVWNLLRKPYHQLLSSGGKGVEITVGGIATVRMPVEFCGGNWESYEPETVKAVSDWVIKHPSALFIDVGCSIGIFCAIALSVSDQVEVVGLESDLSSLQAVLRMCEYYDMNRLRVVHGFVSENSLSGNGLEQASKNTLQKLRARIAASEEIAIKYVCLVDGVDDTIPMNSIDGLFANELSKQKDILLKCDVEGAELLVLHGARKSLARFAPTLLLSVHPPALPDYGHSVEAVREFVEAAGYSIEVLAIDHEEHWWCEKSHSFTELS